jgi:glycosyltransferase involved in cell wall biosynthesis
MNKKVTIVSTSYNQEKYISQTLDSIIIQKTNFPFEVIVSDDCSTDKTPEIIREYAEKYPGIIKPIFREKNIGSISNLY